MIDLTSETMDLFSGKTLSDHFSRIVVFYIGWIIEVFRVLEALDWETLC